MSETIQPMSKGSWKERERKINEIALKLRPVLNIQIRSSSVTQPTISYSSENVLIQIPDYESRIKALEATVIDLQSQIDTHHP